MDKSEQNLILNKSSKVSKKGSLNFSIEELEQNLQSSISPKHQNTKKHVIPKFSLDLTEVIDSDFQEQTIDKSQSQISSLESSTQGNQSKKIEQINGVKIKSILKKTPSDKIILPDTIISNKAFQTPTDNLEVLKLIRDMKAAKIHNEVALEKLAQQQKIKTNKQVSFQDDQKENTKPNTALSDSNIAAVNIERKSLPTEKTSSSDKLTSIKGPASNIKSPIITDAFSPGSNQKLSTYFNRTKKSILSIP